jgi:hypothetical protein
MGASWVIHVPPVVLWTRRRSRKSEPARYSASERPNIAVQGVSKAPTGKGMAFLGLRGVQVADRQGDVRK